jgi:hypothetical protein
MIGTCTTCIYLGWVNIVAYMRYIVQTVKTIPGMEGGG